MSLELFSLEGRAALVIGGKRGLGYAMAEAFAEAGADHRAGKPRSRTAWRRPPAASRRPQAGGYWLWPADATRPDEVERVVEETLRAFGRIDILVNSAGINIRKPVEEMSLG